MLERIFKLKSSGTTIKTELVAGLTTFMTMVYILVVIPSILSDAGMDSGAVFSATAIATALGCMLMGLNANLPIALAPGLGIASFFTYTIVLQMGHSWQTALAATFVEGVVFIILSLCKIRELIVNSIPMVLKNAISVGVGLFVALIGLVNSGVITSGEVFSQMGDIRTPEVALTLISVVILVVLLIKRVPGAFLIGMFITTLIAIPMGIVSLPERFSIMSTPSSIEPIFFQMDFSSLFSAEMLVVLFALIFSDIFDTAGTLIAVCSKSNLMDSEGNVKNVSRAFLSDALATTFGAVLGTSTMGSYVESATGVAAGGRTGLTSMFAGVMFIVALFFTPLFSLVPTAATSAVLVVVGLMMVVNVTKINFEDLKDALPAFIIILFIPLSYGIAKGIVYGFLSYVLIRLIIGEGRKISATMYILAALFALVTIVLS